MKKIGNALYKLSFIISGSTFTAVVLLIGTNVFLRLFHISFAWIEELAYVFFTWCVFFGASLIYGKQGLICIDVLFNRLSPNAQKICAIFTDILLLVVNVCLVIWTINLMRATSRVTPILSISYVYVYLGMLISFIFSVYYSVETLIYRVQGKAIEAVAVEDRA